MEEKNLFFHRLKKRALGFLFPKKKRSLEYVVVQNTASHSVCPFCNSNRIYSRGQIDYSIPVKFADTRIVLDRRAELWECGNCESCFVQNAVREKDAFSFYSIKKSIRWSSTDPFAVRRTRQVVDIVRGVLKPGMSVLDVGCSTGIFLDFAATLGCKTYGIEYAKRARTAASAKGHICNETIDDFDATLSFDAIFGFDVVEHLYDVNAFIKRFAAHIKPGGLLIMFTGDIHCANAIKYSRSWWYLRYPEHVMFPSIQYFSTLPDFEMLTAHKTYGLKWQDGMLGWKLINIAYKKIIRDYHGMPSLAPDHILVILRRK